MILLEDTRQQALKHSVKNECFKSHGIVVERTKLYVGDYTLPTNQSICVDTKNSIQEIIGDICGKQHERFRNELLRARNAEIKLYILVENKDGVTCLDDVFRWRNPRLDIYIRDWNNPIGYYKNGAIKYGRKQKYPSATSGVTLGKCMSTIEKKYGCKFLFCTPEESAEKIIELLGGAENDR